MHSHPMWCPCVVLKFPFRRQSLKPYQVFVARSVIHKGLKKGGDWVYMTPLFIKTERLGLEDQGTVHVCSPVTKLASQGSLSTV